MKPHIFFIIISMFLRSSIFSQSEDEETKDADIHIIKQNMKEFVLREISSSIDDAIAKYFTKIKEDGSWEDVDYKTKRRANWPTTLHTYRMRQMATAFNFSRSRFYKNPDIRDTILRAGDFWAVKDLQCPNWYPNIITVPRDISMTMILMEDHLSRNRFDSWIKIAQRGTAETSGANLAERAIIQILTGCLEKNIEKIEDAVNKVSSDTKIKESIEIQSDMSYHYHGTQYYAGGYGLVHARMFGKLLFILEGTRFQLPDDKIQLIQDYVLDGERWIFYKNMVDYSAMGRGISRIGQSLEISTGAVPYIGMIAEIPKFRYRELRDFYDRLQNHKPIISGNKHFWKSDIMIHRRDNYYASVRMYSKDVANAEVCNDEGKMAKHLADGVTFFMNHANEYESVFPVWDWRRLPGITVKYSQEPLPNNPRIKIGSTFVGGVSDGSCGAAVFDFNREGLSAKKAWFFFDDEFVCLGSDINCASETLLLTSINQCNLNGDVFLNDGNKTMKKEKGVHDVKDALWIYHDRIGYFFPEKSSDKLNRKIILRNDEQTGNWNRINGNLSDNEINSDVFSLWIDHGSKKSDFENSRYSYVVIPDTTPEKMELYKTNNPIRILDNSERIQAVQNASNNLTLAIFHQPASLPISNDVRVSVNGKCLIMIRMEGESCIIAASNPEPMESPLIIDINIPLTGENCRWDEKSKTTKIRFDLPTGDYTGKNVILIVKRKTVTLSE
ncbi:hypothetical protein JW926_18210 [Candidatus Sumerlaeota bacterium]|nr:hypothetical protein [Candidatus Sumerlaeota bacterium]